MRSLLVLGGLLVGYWYMARKPKAALKPGVQPQEQAVSQSTVQTNPLPPPLPMPQGPPPSTGTNPAALVVAPPTVSTAGDMSPYVQSDLVPWYGGMLHP